MLISDLISPERVACGIHSASKKRALEYLSLLIARTDPELRQLDVFESLIARERLGSTGLGKGIAIPHGRLKSSDKTVAAFVRLDQGVDYDAPDGEPVDLLCALMVPPESTEEHLQILASLSEMFSDPQMRDKLRHADSAEDIYELLAHWQSAH